MRIITWNANMAVHRKLDALLSLQPDLAVIPECAAPEQLLPRANERINSMAWVGQHRHKGLGVLAFGEYCVEVLPDYDSRLEWIAPISISGPSPFFLLAAWCMNHRASQQHPWQPPRRQVEPALELYHHLLRPGATVVAGDLNNNVTWDRPRAIDNFTGTIAAADAAGLVSAYHAFHAEDFGAERHPTMYWQTRKEDGRAYHVDFCFVPREWLPRVRSVDIGDFKTWVGSGVSDHVPLVVDLDLDTDETQQPISAVRQ